MIPSIPGFVCSLFDVPDFSVQDYLNREEEFAFCLAPFAELDTGARGKVGGSRFTSRSMAALIDQMAECAID